MFINKKLFNLIIEKKPTEVINKLNCTVVMSVSHHSIGSITDGFQGEHNRLLLRTGLQSLKLISTSKMKNRLNITPSAF